MSDLAANVNVTVIDWRDLVEGPRPTGPCVVLSHEEGVSAHGGWCATCGALGSTCCSCAVPTEERG